MKPMAPQQWQELQHPKAFKFRIRRIGNRIWHWRGTTPWWVLSPCSWPEAVFLHERGRE